MSRWIPVTLELRRKQALINLDHVDVIIGNQICFAGDDSDNYFDVVETFDELRMMIEQAEGTGDKDVV